MTTPNIIARAIFDLIEAHTLRREPMVLAHVEAVVEQAMRTPQADRVRVGWPPIGTLGGFGRVSLTGFVEPNAEHGVVTPQPNMSANEAMQRQQHLRKIFEEYFDITD